MYPLTRKTLLKSILALSTTILAFSSVKVSAFTKVSYSVYRSDGSQSDTQAAVNAIARGGTVEIPNGTFTWTGTLSVNKAIKVKGESKGGVQIVAHNAQTDVVAVTEPLSGSLEISNLDFDFVKADNIWPFAIRVSAPSPRGQGHVLLHDCYFVTNYAYALLWAMNGGVIYNCTFDGSKSSGLSGISFVGAGNNADWTKPSTLGALDSNGTANTYVEDCHFKAYAGINFDDNSRSVLRHSTIDNAGLGSHGQETSPYGTRQWELYDNTFTCDSDNKFNLNFFFSIRGGTGVITGNNFQEIPWGKIHITLNVFSIRRKGQIPCQTQYPAARQVGQGWKGKGGYRYPSVPSDGLGYFTDPIYIWNNTGPGAASPHFVDLNEYNPDECGNGMLIANFVKKDRDYIMGPRPDYAKYPYPHPLRTDGGEPQHTNPRGNASPYPKPHATPPRTGSKMIRSSSLY
jgi:hypothetical protein